MLFDQVLTALFPNATTTLTVDNVPIFDSMVKLITWQCGLMFNYFTLSYCMVYD